MRRFSIEQYRASVYITTKRISITTRKDVNDICNKQQVLSWLFKIKYKKNDRVYGSLVIVALYNLIFIKTTNQRTTIAYNEYVYMKRKKKRVRK